MKVQIDTGLAGVFGAKKTPGPTPTAPTAKAPTPPPAETKVSNVSQKETAVVKDERSRQIDEFMKKVVESRTVRDTPPPPPAPPSSRMLEQTRLEMERGKARTAEHAAQMHANPPPPVVEPKSVPVFRPADYVPDAKSGNIKAQNIR